MRALPILIVLLFAGCAGTHVETRLESPRGGAPALGVAGRPAFAAALEDIEPEIVELPSLSAWPLTAQSGGPFYALAQLSPAVIQMGVLADADRAEVGFGYGILFGYKLLMGGSNSLGLEYILEWSNHHNPSSGVDGTATRSVFAARMTFDTDEKLTPFAVAGLGGYTLDFDRLDSRFNLAGAGLMFGGGVDYAVKRNISVRAELDLHIWDAAEEGSGNGGAAETLSIVAGAAFSF